MNNALRSRTPLASLRTIGALEEGGRFVVESLLRPQVVKDEDVHKSLLDLQLVRSVPGTSPDVPYDLDLAPDERSYAMRLVQVDDRWRYAHAHSALRRTLAHRLNVSPSDVVISRENCPTCGGPHGRPVIRGESLHFSLSHSGDLALVATADRPIGVDLQTLVSEEVVNDLLPMLSASERHELLSTSLGERCEAFTKCWARKEAYLKAIGLGVSNGIAEPIVGTGANPRRVRGWHILDIPVDEGYFAAVAIGRNGCRDPRIAGSASTHHD